MRPPELVGAQRCRHHRSCRGFAHPRTAVQDRPAGESRRNRYPVRLRPPHLPGPVVAAEGEGSRWSWRHPGPHVARLKRLPSVFRRHRTRPRTPTLEKLQEPQKRPEARVDQRRTAHPTSSACPYWNPTRRPRGPQPAGIINRPREEVMGNLSKRRMDHGPRLKVAELSRRTEASIAAELGLTYPSRVSRPAGSRRLASARARAMVAQAGYVPNVVLRLELPGLPTTRRRHRPLRGARAQLCDELVKRHRHHLLALDNRLGICFENPARQAPRITRITAAVAEPRTVAPLRAGRRRATRSAATLEFANGLDRSRSLSAPWVGSDGHSGSLTSAHQSGRGHAGDSGCRASLRASGAHGGVRPQPGGFNHFLDVATEVGVMPRTRTRALAVPDPGHPACSAGARQRMSPSRRP